MNATPYHHVFDNVKLSFSQSANAKEEEFADINMYSDKQNL